MSLHDTRSNMDLKRISLMTDLLDELHHFRRKLRRYFIQLWCPGGGVHLRSNHEIPERCHKLVDFLVDFHAGPPFISITVNGDAVPEKVAVFFI